MNASLERDLRSPSKLPAPYWIPVRVYYQDTDAGGVVFHGQYLSFMERARTELLNAQGFDLARCAAEDRILFMVHAIAVRYHRPAMLNDLLRVSARVAAAGQASVVFAQRVERNGELLVEGEVKLALVGRESLRPVRMPAPLRQLLHAGIQHPDNERQTETMSRRP